MLNTVRQVFWPQFPSSTPSSASAVPASAPPGVVFTVVAALGLAFASVVLYAGTWMAAVGLAEGGARELVRYLVVGEAFVRHHNIHWFLLLTLAFLMGVLNVRRTKALYQMSKESKLGPWDRTRARDTYHAGRSLNRIYLGVALAYLLLALAVSLYELSQSGAASEGTGSLSLVQDRLGFLLSTLLAALFAWVGAYAFLPNAMRQDAFDGTRFPCTVLYNRINATIAKAEAERLQSLKLLHAPLR
ncbi:hypothetical protein LC612_35335 [Nostoc sp. CHAB 5834]|nr:hypothetical protein [Nostoc sp. CHAB 5834]